MLSRQNEMRVQRLEMTIHHGLAVCILQPSEQGDKHD